MSLTKETRQRLADCARVGLAAQHYENTNALLRLLSMCQVVVVDALKEINGVNWSCNELAANPIIAGIVHRVATLTGQTNTLINPEIIKQLNTIIHNGTQSKGDSLSG